MDGKNVAIVPVTTLDEIKNELGNLSLLVREIVNKGRKENLVFKEVMELLKCSRNTVNSYVEKGYFKQYQTGGKYSKIIFKRAEIEHFINSRNAR
ncbi:helix-turn-helix domain-containing protein [Daejeonia sp. YH14]|uniref:helix-turn-helix domain-containing protein n=1 Tax=Daejeonia sp. YH14 TaxID=3439042 RepID=UPI003F4954BB